MKWYTEVTYVDRQTGEIITKKEVEINYIINKTTKEYETRYNWATTGSNGVKQREEYGVIKLTKLCSREGKQRGLWK